ncbi:ABC transporter ATP-binding protein [Actinocatenispora comari]|uniref:ABC transporter ATP-binding protein n=1 Tax=Actinocatenispora comari TaxID=2807577 RepID=UPI001CED44BF|nr:ABC transporter ATP-binding protein [Actinocatenispora comari]
MSGYSTGYDRGVVLRGLKLLGRSIRDEPATFAIGALGSVLFAVMTVASAYVIGAVVGDVAVPAIEAGRVPAGALALGGAAILGVSVLKIVGILGRRLGAGAMQYRLQARYRRAVTQRYLDLPMSWHQRHPTGALLSNANNDVESAFMPIAPFPFAVGTVTMLVTAIVALLVTDWVLALVGVAVFPTVFVINVVYSRRSAPLQAAAQRLRGEVAAVAHESFDGALVVKTAGREAAETARFAVVSDQLRDASIAAGRVRGLFDPLMDALPNVGTLAVLVVGSVRLAAGDLTVPQLVSAAFLFSVLAFPVRAIGWVLGDLPRAVAGADRVDGVLAAEGGMAHGAAELPGTGAVELTFDRVRFGYGDGADVLTDVSFTVPAGRTVALVGATGSGKSTLTQLAARLVDPTDGTVRLAGRDVRELSAAALASTVALVPQVPFVFDDTVHGNVALERTGVGADDAAAALRLAQADRFVAALPDGADTAVGERGASLSGGQRQRVTLARGLAGRPRLLILDDATSAVDPRVEQAILAGLRTTGTDTTVLVVAYRRATIALADEVVYLADGRVAARGTHRELLATVPGYAELVTAYEAADADADDEVEVAG